MKKRSIPKPLIIPLIVLLDLSFLYSEDHEDIRLAQISETSILTYTQGKYSFSLSYLDRIKTGPKRKELKQEDPIFSEKYSSVVQEALSQFSLSKENPDVFYLHRAPDLSVPPKSKKNYVLAGLEVTAINLLVWSYDMYLDKRGWANISWNSVFNNMRQGYEWDNNSFQTNQFSHPYHGAMFYSAARANGLNFLKSGAYTAIGSLMWEFILETNRPSRNDSIMTTFGGMALGEALYKIADLVYDRNSGGLERTLRNVFAFLINPVFGYKIFTGQTSNFTNPFEQHLYSLKLPVGFYSLSSKGAGFLVSTQLEYKDYLKEGALRVKPYDWFSLNLSLGGYDHGIHDVVISITGVLTGKKMKNSLPGLYGIFEYSKTDLNGKISVVGVGPGVVLNSSSDSGYIFNINSIVSVIFGGTDPSFDPDNCHFGKGTENPYYLGPGMMGRINLEYGKTDFGSIGASLSQYWIHSMFTDVNEFLTILSFDLHYPLSKRFEFNIGYDYSIRNALFQETRFHRAKHSVRAMYVYRF
jgi:hypothetical protein